MTFYMRIHEAAKYTGLSEYVLLKMLESDNLPGFYADKKFYVDMSKLLDMLKHGKTRIVYSGLREPKTMIFFHNKPRMSLVEYLEKSALVNELDRDADLAEQMANFTMELRTLHDKGHFNYE